MFVDILYIIALLFFIIYLVVQFFVARQEIFYWRTMTEKLIAPSIDRGDGNFYKRVKNICFPEDEDYICMW